MRPRAQAARLEKQLRSRLISRTAALHSVVPAQATGIGAQSCECTVVGAGAAGLTAAYYAAQGGAQVTVLERTREAGKKILMSGGTRCNVLPMHVDVRVHYTSSAPASAVRAVFNSWSLASCRRWLEDDVGLALVDEEADSKVFPASNSAKEVRDKLVTACLRHGVKFRYNASVESLQKVDAGWRCRLADGSEHSTSRLVLTAGGKSFPAVGTDGTGHRMLAALGVPQVPTFAALTPLVGPHPGHSQLAGLSLYNVSLGVSGVQGGGKKPMRTARTGFLFTHKGFSGPSVLDVSRHLVVPLDCGTDPMPTLRANWTSEPAEVWEERLLTASGKAHVSTVLQRAGVRERLADALLAELGLTAKPVGQLRREERVRLVSLLTAYELQVSNHEGFKKAEVTGGGVDLTHVSTRTMEVQGFPGLYLAGELLDVTGALGGFNFYWAWVSGRLAGLAAGQA